MILLVIKKIMNKFQTYRNDIPYKLMEDIIKNKKTAPVMAIDTETTGLQISTRDRLCVFQFCMGDNIAHIVHFDYYDPSTQGVISAPNLCKLIEDEDIKKLFHYARFDLLAIKKHLGVEIFTNIYCTKIASRLARTYTDRHSLKALVIEIIQIKMDKTQGSSDWGCETLSKDQVEYAGYDVLFLHKIMNSLNTILNREKRMTLAEDCFAFLPVRIDLDQKGWDNFDIFQHSDNNQY